MSNVYLHRRKDNGQVMYVGVGNDERPFTTQSRTKIWEKVKKEIGIEIQVVKSNVEEDYGLMLEAHLINKFKDNGYLVNGSPGHINKFLVYGLTIGKELRFMYGHELSSRGFRPTQVAKSINSGRSYIGIDWYRTITIERWNHLEFCYHQANNKFQCDPFIVGYEYRHRDQPLLENFLNSNYDMYKSIFDIGAQLSTV